MAAKISIFRPLAWFGAARALVVHIDGTKVGKVKSNGTESFDVAPGVHHVWVSMDWCQSQPMQVHLREGETLDLEVAKPPVLASLLNILVSPNSVYELKRKA